MADANANIGINIDTSEALAQLKALQRQIAVFNTSVLRGSETVARAQRDMQQNLVNSINATGQFSAQIVNVRTATETFTNSLEKNKFSMREYFRYATASTKTFGRMFSKEFDTINKVAEDRVKRLQTQYIKLGRDAAGRMQAIGVMPTSLDMESVSTKTAIAAQKQALFNQLLKQGSTNLLNFGKNTQWAGRQLMVGFTIPLSILGNTAAKTFMEMEQAALKFRKVYGDLFTPQEETQRALENVNELANVFTRYGIAASQTVSLAAEAAAAGFAGNDLISQTTEASRLSVLGQIDQQKALETTISLQNAFALSGEQLAESINFLNAVENQTVVSLDDITTAIPKVAPVINQLGGNVKDLAFFLAAMKEGGVNASEGANALKSGLAALINPTEKASAMLSGMGINIKNIIESNQGNLQKTVVEFAQALDKLDPLTRARAIEQLFGKFQFARLSTLFTNVIKQGTQSARVLDLTKASVEDLALTAENELGMVEETITAKFRKAVEQLKVSLMPLGETFLNAITPVVDFFSGLLERFNNLSDRTKKIITVIVTAVAGIGPVLLMTFGLLANGLANIIKLFGVLGLGFRRLKNPSQILTEQTQYLNSEQIDAAASAASLNQVHSNLIQTFNAEAGSIDKLIAAYKRGISAQKNFMASNPSAIRMPKKFAKGVISVPGSGNRDTVPAMLTPGEAVIPSKMAQKYAPLINGMISDNIPGFQDGKMVRAYTNAVMFLSSKANQALKGKGGYSASALSQEISAAGPGIQAPIVRAIAEALGAKNTNDIARMVGSDPSLKQFATNLSGGLAQELSKISGNITDPELAKIYQDVAKKQATQFGQVYQNATDSFFNDLTTFEDASMTRVSQSSGRVRAFGRASLFSGRSSYRGLGYEKVAQALGLPTTKGLVKAHVADSIMISLADAAQQGQLSKPAIAAQERMGATIVASVASGVKKAQKSASASKIAKGLGDDFAQGYIQGIAGGADDAARAASGLTNAAIGGAKQTSRYAGIKSGALTPEQLGAQIPMTAGEIVQQQNQRRGIKGRLGRLAGGATGPLMAASIASSFIPGQLGQVAQTISMVGFAASLLPPQFRLIAAGAGLAYFGFKKFKGAMQEAEDRLYGLANIAEVTKEQTKTLGEFFAIVPRKLPAEILKGPSIATSAQQQRINKLRSDKGFQKEFRKDIIGLRSATDTRAAMSQLFAKATVLRGQGFSSAMVQTIVEAIKQEAKRTDIFIDIKSIDFSKQSLEKLKSTQSPLVKNFNKALNTGLKASVSPATGELVEWRTNQEEFNAATKALANNINSIATGAAGMFETGVIGVQKYKNAFSTLTSTLEDAGDKQIILNDILKRYDKQLGTNTSKITEYKDQLLIFQAITLGVGEQIIRSLVALSTFDKGAYTQAKESGQARVQLADEIGKKLTEVEKQVAKARAKATGGSGELNALEKRIKAINQETKAYENMIKLGIDASTAKELASDGEIAKLMQTEKATGALINRVKEYARVVKALEDVQIATMDQGDYELLRLEKAQKYLELQNELIDVRYSKELDRNQKEQNANSYAIEQLNYQSSIIEKRYDKQISSLEKIFDLNQQIAEIEQRRTTLLSALSSGDISASVQALQELRRVRASQTAQNQINNLTLAKETQIAALRDKETGKTKEELQDRNTILELREKEIDLIKQKQKDTITYFNMTKLEIDNAVSLLNLSKNAGININDPGFINNVLSIAKTEAFNLKEELKNVATEATNALNAMAKLREKKDDTGVTLTDGEAKVGDFKQTGTGSAIGTGGTTSGSSLLLGGQRVDIPDQPFTTKTGITIGGSSGATQYSPQTSWITQYSSQLSQTAANYLKDRFGFNMGGIVPKYFANGGYGRGTDTIPAMLTPGEYVVRKNAVDVLGLNTMNKINNGEMPSSVYNYNLNVSLNGSNMNPNDVARVVMQQIKQVESQRLRGY